ncbi:MAG: NfeD family protein [Proteobacteria bacterium]|nr:NfeD family protein [Pseudomonadota bacterium]
MKGQGWTSRVVLKYTLLQLPALALLIVILILAGRWFDIPSRYSLGILLLWVAKDVALFPFVWRAYDTDPRKAANTMIGRLGMARDRLSPSGYVFIRGELWQAEVIEGNSSIEKGGTVRVHGVRGLTLLVTPDPPEQDSKPKE